MAGKDRYLLNRDGRYAARLVIPKDLRYLGNLTKLRMPLGPADRAARRWLHGAVAELQHRIALFDRKKAQANCQAPVAER